MKKGTVVTISAGGVVWIACDDGTYTFTREQGLAVGDKVELTESEDIYTTILTTKE